MRALLQRVLNGEVRVAGNSVAQIGEGYVILLGVRKGDTEESAKELAERCSNMRLFQDDHGKMNLSVREIDGSVLVVSQFTLYADTRRGNRPGFSDAAPHELAQPLYLAFVDHLKHLLGPSKVATGVFKEMMEVTIVNNGPVTIMLDDRASASLPSSSLEINP